MSGRFFDSWSTNPRYVRPVDAVAGTYHGQVRTHDGNDQIHRAGLSKAQLETGVPWRFGVKGIPNKATVYTEGQ